MRAFDGEVEELSRWFNLCYEIAIEPRSGVAMWRRVAFPAAGGAGDQDARLMHALEWACEVQNRLLAEDRSRKRSEARQAEEKRVLADERSAE